MKDTIQSFVVTQIGDPYRLFPFGLIVKDGYEHEITPESAKDFKLPHFKPAIKMGSHEEETPAAGHIIGLEIREDGIYAIPEWNEQGAKAVKDGAYRYHSPEILWEGMMERPDGSMISGPIIVADALLHMPHLGEATAFYESNTKEGDDSMSENVTIPQSLFDKFMAWIGKTTEPEQTEPPVPVIETAEYKAVMQERDQYAKVLKEQEDAKKLQEKIAKYNEDLKESKAPDEKIAEILAKLDGADADVIVKAIKGLSAQVSETNITGEIGNSGDVTGDPDPKAAFNAVVLSIVNEKKIGYNAAFEEAKVKNQDLFLKAFATKK